MQEELKKLTSICSWFIAIQIVTLLSFLGGAGFIYADLQKLKLASTNNSATGGAPKQIDGWQQYVRSHNPAQGNSNAKIVLVEFTDFQCPFCKTFSEGPRSKLIEKYGDQIRVVFKHFPLEQIHPDAKQAAVAAQCALHEGKFWEVAKVLFESQDQLSLPSLITAGERLGLGSRYASCLNKGESIGEVEQDIKDGKEIGIQGTPSFMVNGKLIFGAAQLESTLQGLQEALRK